MTDDDHLSHHRMLPSHSILNPSISAEKVRGGPMKVETPDGLPMLRTMPMDERGSQIHGAHETFLRNTSMLAVSVTAPTTTIVITALPIALHSNPRMMRDWKTCAT